MLISYENWILEMLIIEIVYACMVQDDENKQLSQSNKIL